MSHTRNTRDIREQEDAQPAPEDSPTTPGGATPHTAAEDGPQYGLPEEETPSVAEITSGARPKKRNKRLQNIIKWSREEKKIIYLCYQVSHNKIWGKGKSKRIFREQLERSELDQEKVRKTTDNKFSSIVSQIPGYLDNEILKEIERTAETIAQEMNINITEEEKIGIYKNQWSRSEKYILLWALEYSQQKIPKANKERTRTFSEIFFPRCQYKQEFDPKKRSTVKNNILKCNIFTTLELDNMKIDVAREIQMNTPIDQINIGIPQKQEEAIQCNLPDLMLDNSRQENFGFVNESVSTNQEIDIFIQNIRNNPVELLGSPPSSDPSSSSSESSIESLPSNLENDQMINNEDNEQPMTEEETDICNQIVENYNKYKNVLRNKRPHIPKTNITKVKKEKIKKANTILPKLIHHEANLTELNDLTYAVALTINNNENQTFPQRKKYNIEDKLTPWKRKQIIKIRKLQSNISRIEEYKRGTRTRKLNNRISQLKEKFRRHNITNLDEIKTEEINKLKAESNRLKKYDQKEKTKSQNALFSENPKRFYRIMCNDTIEITNLPDENQLSNFWRDLYGDSTDHNRTAEWIDQTKNELTEIPDMQDIVVTEETIKNKLRKAPNFKSPGPDKVQNFWMKQLTSLHSYYARSFTRLINKDEQAPDWLTEGITHLIPKSENTDQPNQYRPITCLPTVYKLLTGIIADNMYDHLMNNNLVSKEQSGCKRDCYGVKDQLLLNKTVTENAKRNGKNLFMAWIDYKKAFDSVPHSWIIESLKIYKVSPNIIQLIEEMMPKWKTTLNLKSRDKAIKVPDVSIKRGIFQGDSLSPLLFILTIDPLSRILNRMNTGYNLNKRQQEPSIVNHLLYMDDLKLYNSKEKSLKDQLTAVLQFSHDINMEFGINKCAKISIIRGKHNPSQEIQIDQNTSIKELDRNQVYKYLGIAEAAGLDHQTIRNKTKKEYFNRIKRILKTNLTAKNKISAINQLAIPALQYTFGIIDWPQNIIDQIDVRTRKYLTMYKLFYKLQNHDRLYLPRHKGGIGLLNINNSHRATTIATAKYITSSNNTNLQAIVKHEQEKSEQKSLLKLSNNFLQQNGIENLEEEREQQDNPATKLAKKLRQQFCKSTAKGLEDNWKNDRRAGRIKTELDKEHIDKKGSIKWLQKGILQYDGERMILAAQDQGLTTRATLHVLYPETDPQCRFCRDAPETAAHLLSHCSILLQQDQYTTRHNRVCNIIHWNILKQYNINVSEKYWEHLPKSFESTAEVDIYYDKPIQLGQYIDNRANRPDIIIHNKKKKEAQIIEIGITSDIGITATTHRKTIKYADFKNILKREWELNNVDLIPVVMGVTGIYRKSLHNELSKIWAPVDVDQMQSAVVREGVSILKRALSLDM